MSKRISVVIPTYRREQVLVDTVRHLLALSPAPFEILLVDQTPEHSAPVRQALEAWNGAGRVGWLRQETPSIPQAMNRGLTEAAGDLVLFLDDDIEPEPRLIAAHLQAHRETGADMVAGRIIQPWQEEKDFSQDSAFHFASTRGQWIERFMGGNFSVKREVAMALGGFDERFVKAAYNFEAEFAHRFRRAGYRIHFEPQACLHHLKAGDGGTRTFGHHLTTVKPDHAVGDYYFLLRTRGAWRGGAGFLHRAIRSVATRHHLRRPWWIPVTLAAELSGMIWALSLAARGPRYIAQASLSKGMPFHG